MTKIRQSLEKLEGPGQIRLADGKSVPVRFALVVFRMVDDDADTGQLPDPVGFSRALGDVMLHGV